MKQLKLSRQPTATDCFLILFLRVYKRQGLSSPDLSFIKYSPHSLSIIYILSSLTCDIFGNLHTLNFVIVNSALHSVKEDVKMCFLRCIFKSSSDVMLTTWSTLQHQSNFCFLSLDMVRCHHVPDLTRPDGKTNMF